METNRQIQPSHPRAYSVEDLFDRTRAKPDGHRHYRSEAWRSLKLYV